MRAKRESLGACPVWAPGAANRAVPGSTSPATKRVMVEPPPPRGCVTGSRDENMELYRVAVVSDSGWMPMSVSVLPLSVLGAELDSLSGGRI